MSKKYNLIIGRHCLLKAPGYLPGAVEEATSYDANSLMIYLGAPQNSFRQPLNVLKVPEFKKSLRENNISIHNIVVHGSYLINLANTVKKEVFDFSVEFLKKEIKRMEEIGLKILVLHPGSYLNATQQKGLEQIAHGLNLILTENSAVRIALETMSGKGSELGTTFEQLKSIIDKLKFKERVGICWDTCHLYSAGYDIKENLEIVIKDFDRIIGLDKLWAVHLNDSMFGLGAKKDRHENIGHGKIGLQALKRIAYHPKFNGIIKLLETPRQQNFQAEIKNLKSEN